VFTSFGLFLQPFSLLAGWIRRTSLSVERAVIERRRQVLAERDLRSLDEYMLRDLGLSHRAAGEWRSRRREER
jgi:hypothetical protein